MADTSWEETIGRIISLNTSLKHKGHLFEVCESTHVALGMLLAFSAYNHEVYTRVGLYTDNYTYYSWVSVSHSTTMLLI